MAHGDHRAGDGGVVGIVGQLAHEAAVDLELVQRELLEIGQAGIAGTKIVQRQRHAQGLEFGQPALHALDVFHQRTFGQLDLQHALGHAVPGQGVAHQVDDVGALQLLRGNVHRHREAAAALVDPGAQLTAGLVHHPAADFRHQAQGFGDRDETARRHRPQVGAVPAHQGLEAGDAAVGGAQLRLVVQAQLVAGDGVAQAGAQHQPVLELLHLRGGKFAGIVAALAFGPGHGRLGAAQQLHRALAVFGRAADADAGGQVEPVAVAFDRLRQRGAHLARQVGGARGIGVRRDRHELVAGEPGQEGRAAQHRAQPLGDQAQGVIADHMAHGFVDGVEVVDVDVEQRHHRALPLQQAGQRGLEDRETRQAGDGVVVGGEGQLGLDLAAFGQVVLDADKMRHAALAIAHRRQEQVVPELAAVLALVAEDDVAVGLVAQGLAQHLQLRLLARRALQEAAVPAHRLLGRITGHAFEGRIDVDDRQVRRDGVGDHHAVDARLDRTLQQLQALARLAFGGDVVGDHHPALAAVEHQIVGGDVGPDPAAVLALVPPDAGIAGPVAPAGKELGQALALLRRPDIEHRHGQQLVARIAVVGDGGVVGGDEAQRPAVVDPGGIGAETEQQLVAALAVLDLGDLPRAFGGVTQRPGQLFGVDRALDQVVGGAGRQCLAVHVGIALAGEHDHRPVRAALGHRQAHQLHAVVGAQLVVDQEHVVLVRAQGVDALAQGGDPFQVEALLRVVREQVAQDQEILFVVVDHQDAQGSFGHACPRSGSVGRSTICSQYLPSACTTSIREAKLTGLVMKELAPSR